MCENVKVASVVKILQNPDDFTSQDINPHYYLKASHGCGWNIDLQGKTIHDVISIRKKLKLWNQTYSYTEKQYIHISPRFFIETKIYDKYHPIANVYMIRCIYGKPVSIGIVVNSQNYLYDTNWGKLDSFEGTLPKPDELNQLLEISAKLSKPFEFVRIDLYIAKDGIYFSEFTFTPASGNRVFSMPLEMEMGASWF